MKVARRCRRTPTVPPAWVIVSEVEIQECAVVMTSSPGFDVRARASRCRARRCRWRRRRSAALRTAAANSRSNARTNGPRMKADVADHVGDRRVDLALDGQVLRVQIGEGNGHGVASSLAQLTQQARAGLPA